MLGRRRCGLVIADDRLPAIGMRDQRGNKAKGSGSSRSLSPIETNAA